MNDLKKLVKCFKESLRHSSDRLSTPVILRFLLGSAQTKKISNSTLESAVQNGYIDKKYLTAFCRSPISDWENKQRYHNSLGKEINFRALEFEIHECMKECYLEESDSFGESLRTLAAYAFWGITDANTLFVPYTHPKLENYVSWNSMENKIREKIANHNLTIIIGEPGSGKKLLTTKVLKDHFSDCTDIHFLPNSGTSLEQQLCDIDFVDGKHDNLDLVISYLEEKTATSFLVIRRPHMTHSDLNFIQNLSSRLSLKIIILTRSINLPESPSSLFLEERSFENLKSIYTNTTGNPDFSDDDLKIVFKTAFNNPCVISLIGKIKEKPTELRQKLLNPTEWVWYTTGIKKIHGNYRTNPKSGQTIKKLISVLFDYYPENENKFLSRLSIWTKVPIFKDLLLQYGDISEKELDYALNLGIVYASYESFSEDAPIIFMHPLIADSIWSCHSISYRYYRDKLLDFLHLLHIGNNVQIPYGILYPLIRVLLQRFHFQISVAKSTEDPRNDPYFMEWHDLLVSVIHRLSDLGDYKIAEEFLPYVFHYRSCYKQLQEDKDAATADEHLIREMLELKMHHMRNGITSSNIPDIIEVLNRSKKSFLENNKAQTSLGLYFVMLEMHSVLDYIINMENVYLLNHLSDNSFLGSSRTQLFERQFQTYLQIKQQLKQFDDSYYYYHFVYDALVSIYSNTTQENDSPFANEIIKQIDQKNFAYETAVKFHCQNLYYKLIKHFKNHPQSAWITCEFHDLQWEYDHLFNLLYGSMFSWEIPCVFFLSTYIFSQYINFLHDCTKKCIETEFQLFEEFLENQLTMSPKEHLYLTALSEKIFHTTESNQS